jgi:argininosuccinate lyase
MTEKPWSGRFSEPTDAFVEAFTASIDFDRRLARHDIAGSKAHARMLGRQGVLGEAEVEAILGGLDAIDGEIDAGEFPYSVALEDIHMNIEARLTERIGEAGKRLHTGRSRNDQIATDLRLYVRDEIDALLRELHRFQQALVEAAEREADTVMPGFTHLQAAQPVTLGHHLLAYFEMADRDAERLRDARRRVNRLPLGAGALAGTTFPIDREWVARELGFDGVTENSLDSVSDRDFAVETVHATALAMAHLSRLAEELVLWASPQFGFAELPQSFCTGSSIMPQKMNPDVPELVRGKTGRVNGDLMGLLTLLKSQPLAYNKDMQEDKEPVFDALDTLRGSLKVFADMVPGIAFDRAAMHHAASAGFSTATDLADYLVRKGLPFREAHAVVGGVVQHCIDHGLALEEVALDTFRQWSEAIDGDVYEVLTVEGSVAARDHIGGTAPDQVRAAATRARQRIGL